MLTGRLVLVDTSFLRFGGLEMFGWESREVSPEGSGKVPAAEALGA